MYVDADGKKLVYLGSGCSSELGPIAEQKLLELFHRGWPPEWGNVHSAALCIARSQGTPPPLLYKCNKIVGRS